MSLQEAFEELKETLLEEASTPATYREKAGATKTINILLCRQEQKAMDAQGTETISYERHVELVPSELGDYGVPHVGARIVYTDAAGRVVTLEVNNDHTGHCFRPTKSGQWSRVFCKELANA